MRGGFVVGLAGLLLGACASEPAPGAADLGAAEPALECGALSRCGRRCVNLQEDPQSCGACDRTCVIPNGEAGCRGGECVVAACAEGFFDSDRRVGNGCESQSSCRVSKEACNGQDDDCNGRCDEGPLPGCRVGVHRAVGDGAHFYTTDLGAATRPPFTLETANYFYLYAAEVPGTRAVYLCRKPSGKYFLTSSAVCEGVSPAGQLLGYWGAERRCDGAPLYRLYHGGADDHFYTSSEAERDNAAGRLGFQPEGLVGYVWSTP